MLERTSVVINDTDIEARIEVGLPAAGRKILGKAAAHTIIDTLPEIVDQALHYQHLDHSKLQDQVNLIKDQMYIREELDKRNLVSFVANNAILPRQSGVSDRLCITLFGFKVQKNLRFN